MMSQPGSEENVERHRVEGESDIYNPSHNRSEANLEESLREMRMHNQTFLPSPHSRRERGRKANATSNNMANVTSNIVGPDGENCSDDIKGVIILNVLGLLANDLFEAAFARRMASQLGCGWHVIYRTMWNPAFPTTRTDVCFPNALASDNSRRQNSVDRTKEVLGKIGTGGVRPSLLYKALTYNLLEPNNHRGWDGESDDRANKLYQKWIESLGEKALTIEHMEYPLQKKSVDKLVAKLLNPSSQVQVLDLRAFFIHFDWMSGWMDQIVDWLRIDPSCCTTPAPSKDAVVIHIRDFEPEDEDKNKHLEVGVYRDIMDRYHSDGADEREVIVVCQPKSAKTDLVLALVEELGAKVRTGADNTDALCLLSQTRGALILSTSSSFSEMGALLAESKNVNVQVHYPTHTLHNPAVTIKVPSWKYHLVNQTQVLDFDVAHERLKVTQA